MVIAATTINFAPQPQSTLRHNPSKLQVCVFLTAGKAGTRMANQEATNSQLQFQEAFNVGQRLKQILPQLRPCIWFPLNLRWLLTDIIGICARRTYNETKYKYRNENLRILHIFNTPRICTVQ